MHTKIILTPEEARVLGCLIEKSQATPEYYPMSLNALVNACNQKNSRDPVVNYSDEEVISAIEQLKERGLCSAVTGAGRVTKYIHRVGEGSLGLNAAEMCSLSVLLLRGPQTAGEIKIRAGRQFDFSSTEAVQDTLTSLMAVNKKYVELTARRAGQKEVRYRHLFFQYNDAEVDKKTSASSSSIRDDIESLKQLITSLRNENKILRDKIEQIEIEIEKMKKDFY